MSTRTYRSESATNHLPVARPMLAALGQKALESFDAQRGIQMDPIGPRSRP
ncbi:hypothetical protein [Aeromicrobium sp. Root495]|uniref:hypothetical protein n=1 Tax=Aeromicrobium sp. Root495 TaxID=1736550 RepID=UPI000AEB0647|nr:hypothetical protein [Aeromicrobium sp. Root495]